MLLCVLDFSAHIGYKISPQCGYETKTLICIYFKNIKNWKFATNMEWKIVYFIGVHFPTRYVTFAIHKASEVIWECAAAHQPFKAQL